MTVGAMYVNFTKSLDRPVEIFGVKGRWIVIFLVMAGVSFVLGLIVGFSASAGYGISVVLLFVSVSFIACHLLQGRVSHREVEKVAASMKVIPCVQRRETLCRILLPDTGVKCPFYERNVGDCEDGGKDHNKNGDG